VVEKTTENIVGREAESTLEKGRKHHNLFGVGCSDVFPFSRMPLEHPRLGRKQFSTNLRILLSSAIDCWNKHG
jgi:hypothetical protein